MKNKLFLVFAEGQHAAGEVACYLNGQQICVADSGLSGKTADVMETARSLASSLNTRCHNVSIAAPTKDWTWVDLYAQLKSKIEDAQPLTETRDQYRVIGVSTAHIPQRDRDLLGSADHPRILSRSTGALVKLCDAESPLQEQFPAFSQFFYNVLELADIAGFQMIEFDAAATEYDNLIAFD